MGFVELCAKLAPKKPDPTKEEANSSEQTLGSGKNGGTNENNAFLRLGCTFHAPQQLREQRLVGDIL
jgi:hypothetical protein